jgi:hypothetical protein
VPFACNPSYSGGRDQKNRGSKPAWANSSQDSVSKNRSQKRAGGTAQGVGLSSNSRTAKKKKKKKERKRILGLFNCY